MRKLLEENPAIGALYDLSGANFGMAEAVAEAGCAKDVLLVAHDANELTVPLLQMGKLDFVTSQDPRQILTGAFRMIDTPKAQRTAPEALVEFSVNTAHNIPPYSRLMSV